MDKRNHIAWTLVGVYLVITPCGCVVDEEPDGRLPISGRVTYRGLPVKNGTINFLPFRDSGATASGRITNGVIRDVTTRNQGDGLKEGSYKVTIVAFEEADTVPRDDRFNGPTNAEVAELVANAKILIPLKYSSLHGSDITIDVSADNCTFEFDLKDD
jgi:hypothetical protein